MPLRQPAPLRRRAALCRPVVAALAALLACDQAAAGPLRTVALTGQLVPGTTTGETFQSFSNLQINSRGKVAFSGAGIWTDSSGNLKRAVKFGEQAPGLPLGVTLAGVLEMAALNRSGELAFYCWVSGPDVTSDSDESIWSTASGQLALVARDGDPAPGLPAGSTYFYVWVDSAFNDAGQTLYSGGIRAPGGTFPEGGGLWMDNRGVRVPVVQDGDHLPGMPVGGGLNSAPLSAPLNRAGQVAFQGEISPPDELGVYEQGIWQGSPANMRLVMKTGAQAPGTTPGVVFASAGFRPMQNHFGQVAFNATLSGVDVIATNNFGFWRERAGGVDRVWRAGETPSGVPQGVLFSSSDTSMVGFNEMGHVAVSTTLAGPGVTLANDQSLWLRRDNSFNLIVREGDHAPGTAASVTFTGFGFSHALNATGQLAFFADVTGPGVSPGAGNNRGLWATDAAGNAQLIARTGDAIEVAPGVWRTPTDLSISLRTTNIGQPTGFNDRGQVAFQATFSDGTSGLFVSDAVAITPGDFNRDGSVTGADLAVWRATMATPTATPNLFADGDFDGDVDGDDLLVWQRNLSGPTPIVAPAQRPVPEPAAAILLAAALLVMPHPRRIFI